MLRTLLVAFCLAASASLARAADGPEVKITIADSTAGDMMAQAYKQNVGVNQKSDEGYEKVEQVGDLIVRESYKNAESKGSLTALVKERTTVEIDTTGLPASAMREWLERVDTAVVADAKPDEETKVIPQGDLVKALPPAPDGWKASRPEEVTSSTMGFTLSQAIRTYEKKK